MKNYCIILLLSAYFSFSSTDLQSQDSLQILFWNVENLFYPENDSLNNDEEFTPDGVRYWSFYRYWKKINLLWKTILSAGFEDPPEIIGLCEIENRKVLEDMFLYSPLRKFNYQIIHKDSPDSRGIDVALIVRANLFDTIYSEFIKAGFPELNGRPTREILHATLIKNAYSLHLFVNHWPSKYGGTGYTDILRIRCAELLLSNIQTVQNANQEASIICMGDFNDIPESRSIQLLVANNEAESTLHLLEYESGSVAGSLKYQGRWESIDQFFVNNQLLNGEGGFVLASQKTKIYSFPFLFEKDEKYGGKKPCRSYIGYKYNGGISDHLPVGIDVVVW